MRNNKLLNLLTLDAFVFSPILFHDNNGHEVGYLRVYQPYERIENNKLVTRRSKYLALIEDIETISYLQENPLESGDVVEIVGNLRITEMIDKFGFVRTRAIIKCESIQKLVYDDDDDDDHNEEMPW